MKDYTYIEDITSLKDNILSEKHNKNLIIR